MIKNPSGDFNSKKTSMITPILAYISSMLLLHAVILLPRLTSLWTMDDFLSHLYIFGTAGQALMDLPPIILFIFLRKRLNADNTLMNKPVDCIKGLTAGLIGALILAGVRLLISGHLMGYGFMGGIGAFTQSAQLTGPWNVISSALAILTYGPGEAMFVIYLILAFDNSLGNRRMVSWGVIITSLLWAVPHLTNILFFGSSAISNVFIMFIIGILMGVLFKTTRSVWAPIIFWVLVNGTSF